MHPYVFPSIPEGCVLCGAALACGAPLLSQASNLRTKEPRRSAAAPRPVPQRYRTDIVSHNLTKRPFPAYDGG